MTTEATTPPNHLHFFNHHTGRPRFHFDAASDAAAAAAATTNKPWHDGVAPETLGFWQNKGLPLDDPKTFGAKFTELYQNAEKFIGGDPNQIVRLPKADSKPEEIAAFRTRLGWPEKADGYDFSAIKDAAGQPIAAALADALRASLHSNGIAKDAGAAVAAEIVKTLDGIKTTEKSLTAGKIAEERTKLEANWGGKDSATYQFNHLQAMEGARRLAITPEAIKLMEGQIGYAATMDAMRKVGAARGEDVFVTPPGGGPQGGGAPTTREAAMARKSELMADKAWGARWTAGGAAERAEYDRLNLMINGESA